MDEDKKYEILNASRRMIFNQIEGLYNAILTISGGALVLSLTLINLFGQNPKWPWILKSSWIVLLFSIIANILMRYLLKEASIIDLNKEHFKLNNPQEPIKDFFKKYKPEAKYMFFYKILFWSFWLSFIVGLSLLLIFAIKNS